MRLRCINDRGDFAAIEKEWNALVEASPADHLFMRHELLLAWWEAFVGDCEVCILIAEDHGRLAGGFPLKISRDKIRGLPAQKISFLTDSSWTSGDLAVINNDPEAIKLFSDYLLERSWDIIDLQNVHETPAIAALAEAMQKERIGFSSVEASVFPCLRTTGDWEGFFRSRSTRFRKASRNKLNKMKKAGSFEVRRFSSAEELSWALGKAFEIGLKGWKHANLNNAISSTEENRRFYSALARAAEKAGTVDIWLLSLDGAYIAFEYHLRSGTDIIALTADFDEAYRRLSPGSVIDFHIMKELFSTAGITYSMGCGESFYKSSWTDEAIRYRRVLFFRDTAYGKLLGFTEKKVAGGIKALRDRLRKKQRSRGPQTLNL